MWNGNVRLTIAKYVKTNLAINKYTMYKLRWSGSEEKVRLEHLPQLAHFRPEIALRYRFTWGEVIQEIPYHTTKHDIHNW